MNNILAHFGVGDLSCNELDMFKVKQSGKTLLFDGDGICYNPEIVGAAKLETVLRRFEGAVLEMMFRAGCDNARVHLTPKGCFKNGRHLLRTVKPYQEQRAGKPKPRWLEPLRSTAPTHFADHPDIDVFGHYDIEADDALMIDHYALKDTVLASADKDLKISPHLSFDIDEGTFLSLPNGDTFGWIGRKDWLTDAGKKSWKVVGKGTKFFWAQMLMGDTADNVKGIISYNAKLCGGAGALALLNPITDESEAANLVIDGYRAIDQNVIAEAEAMWLLRTRDDSSIKYMQGLDLSHANKSFLESWIERGYRDEPTEEEYAEND